jgi:hypothetical protein
LHFLIIKKALPTAVGLRPNEKKRNYLLMPLRPQRRPIFLSPKIKMSFPPPTRRMGRRGCRSLCYKQVKIVSLGLSNFFKSLSPPFFVPLYLSVKKKQKKRD